MEKGFAPENQRSREGITERELGKKARPKPWSSELFSPSHVNSLGLEPFRGSVWRVCSFSSSTDLTVGAPSPGSPARVF